MPSNTTSRGGRVGREGERAGWRGKRWGRVWGEGKVRARKGRGVGEGQGQPGEGAGWRGEGRVGAEAGCGREKHGRRREEADQHENSLSGRA